MAKETETEVTRRSFLGWAIGAGVAFVATLLGIPVIGAIIGTALRPSEAQWVSLGSATGFPEGTPTSTQFSVTRQDGWINTSETRSVWVVRHGASDFAVFSGRCTHLGCAYHWNAAQNRFICPCHDGHFAIDGRVIGGPPPRPLDPLPVRLEGGELLILPVDFRLGIPERVAT